MFASRKHNSTALELLTLVQETGMLFLGFFLLKYCQYSKDTGCGARWALGTLGSCSLAHRVSVSGAKSFWCEQEGGAGGISVRGSQQHLWC